MLSRSKTRDHSFGRYDTFGPRLGPFVRVRGQGVWRSEWEAEGHDVEALKWQCLSKLSLRTKTVSTHLRSGQIVLTTLGTSRDKTAQTPEGASDPLFTTLLTSGSDAPSGILRLFSPARGPLRARSVPAQPRPQGDL